MDSMHGLVHAELKKFVKAQYGSDVWNELVHTAGLEKKEYVFSQAYPDKDVLAIVAAASDKLGKPAQAVLEDFGKFIVPDLIGLYGGYIDPEWRTLDLLENTEKTIHCVVRAANLGAIPPNLTGGRRGPNEVAIIYNSKRKMCGFAKGIIRGIADHYGEEVSISEGSCMLEGASSCVLSVKLLQ